MGPKGVTPSNGWSWVSVLLRADMFSNLSPETVRLGSSRAVGEGKTKTVRLEMVVVSTSGESYVLLWSQLTRSCPAMREKWLPLPLQLCP